MTFFFGQALPEFKDQELRAAFEVVHILEPADCHSGPEGTMMLITELGAVSVPGALRGSLCFTSSLDSEMSHSDRSRNTAITLIRYGTTKNRPLKEENRNLGCEPDFNSRCRHLINVLQPDGPGPSKE
jgi:hypothetical protein